MNSTEMKGTIFLMKQEEEFRGIHELVEPILSDIERDIANDMPDSKTLAELFRDSSKLKELCDIGQHLAELEIRRKICELILSAKYRIFLKFGSDSVKAIKILLSQPSDQLQNDYEIAEYHRDRIKHDKETVILDLLEAY